MRFRWAIAAGFVVLATAGCDKGTAPGGTGGGPKTAEPVRTAMEACKRFVAASAASNCREESVEPALTPGAKSRVLFDLPSGKRGQVFAFSDKDDYEKSAKTIEDMKAAGKHTWGNAKAKIYVQLNKDANDDESKKLRDVLDGF